MQSGKPGKSGQFHSKLRSAQASDTNDINLKGKRRLRQNRQAGIKGSKFLLFLPFAQLKPSREPMGATNTEEDSLQSPLILADTPGHDI